MEKWLYKKLYNKSQFISLSNSIFCKKIEIKNISKLHNLFRLQRV